MTRDGEGFAGSDLSDDRYPSNMRERESRRIDSGKHSDTCDYPKDPCNCGISNG